MSEAQTLREEIALLRAEVRALRDCLTSTSPGDPLHLRVASLEIVGQSAQGEASRFRVSLKVEEHGGALYFHDSEAGESAVQAALRTGEDGTFLALCASNGVPRAIFAAREEGGGASFLDEKGELGAEIYGAGEASWLMLNHDGAPGAVSAATAQGGNLELFDADGDAAMVLPVKSAGA